MRSLAVLFALAGTPVLADLPDCEAIAAQAGAQAGIPDTLLPAISRMETGIARDGGERRAWPWTLNQGGNSMYFDTKEEALAYLQEAVAGGVTNIDVGCMQINYRWHHDNFGSLAEMMDPLANTRYAAAFLTELFERTGTWEEATRTYHSTDEMRGQNYGEGVAAIMADIAIAPPTVIASLRGFLTPRGRPLVDLGETADAYLQERTAVGPENDDWTVPRPLARPEGLGIPRRETVRVSMAGDVQLATPDMVPPRLQRDWDKVEAFRELLARRP